MMGKGAARGLFSFLCWMKNKKMCSLFQVCATVGITQRGLTARSAAMGITGMQRQAQPWTASPARAPVAPAVPSCPAQGRLCAPAARLALQVSPYQKGLCSTPHVPVGMSSTSSAAVTHSEWH